MQDLRQSTAGQEISLGQFLDSTDGDTEENGLTIANTDIKIRKHGATTLANKNSGGATSISNGVYYAVLNATDTDTAGMLEVYVHVAGALAVKVSFNVLTATAFDAKYTGTFYNFDPTNDAVVNVTNVTTAVTVGAINSGVITAATIAANALDGKGDWNVDKTGYSISGTITILDELANFDPTTELVDLNVDQSSVTIGTVNTVTGLVSGTGGISVAASDFTLTVGGTPVNDVTDTRSKNGVHHEIPDDAGNTDFYYEFDIGFSGVPQTITWFGWAKSNGDSYQISAYNYGLASYEPLETITAVNGEAEMTQTVELLIDHVGTGSDSGKVRWRIDSSDGTEFGTDRIFCTYTETTSGIPNGSTITLEAAATNQSFVGHNWELILNGQIISGSYFFQATNFSGTGIVANGNSITIDECILQSTILDSFIYMRQSGLCETLTLLSTSGGLSDSVNMVDCNSAVEGDETPVVDASGITKTLALQSRKWGGGCTYIINAFCTLSHETTVGGDIILTSTGGVAEVRGEIKSFQLTSSNSAVTTLVITSGGPIVVNGSSGTLNVFGLHGGITDNSGGAVTINDLGIDMIAIQTVTNSISIHAGLVQASTINTVTLSADSSSVDGAYDPATIRIFKGTGAGQTRLIYQYDGTTKIAVVDRNWKVNPDTTSQFTINSDPGREHVNEGQLQGATNNTATLNTLASSVDDAYNGQTIFLRSGNGDDQSGLVIAYNGATKVATVSKNWGLNPDNTTGYAMLPTSPSALSEDTQTQIDDIQTAAETDIPAQLDSMSGTGFNSSTDSLEALRNRGDTAWVTATGFAQAGDEMNLVDGAITAAKIAANALDSKGNWNINKTGYSISGTIQTLDGLNNFNPASDTVARVALVDETTLNTDMVAEAPTPAENRAEMDSSSTQLAKLGTPNVDVSADIAAVKTVVDDVPNTSEFEARTPTPAQLAYIVENAATGVPITFTTLGGSVTEAVFNLVDENAGSSTDDQYNGKLIVFTSGTLKGVVTDITDYDGATTTATITGIPFAPTAVHTARLL